MTNENERDGTGRGETPVHRFRHDWADDRSLSTDVVRAVAVAAGVAPTDLDERLADVVDADALDGLFEPSHGAPRPVNRGVWFDVSGYGVIVYGNGEIVVRSSTPGDEPGLRRGGSSRANRRDPVDEFRPVGPR